MTLKYEINLFVSKLECAFDEVFFSSFIFVEYIRSLKSVQA